ncbi:MAG: DUF5752 family protein [Thermodesulfobacteriota bacterium]
MEPIVSNEFEFRQCIGLTKSTGQRACTLRELRDLIATISTESIFHHTYQYFLKGHSLEYTNDFGHWAGECLEERALSEYLCNIDIFAFTEINDLRNEILGQIDIYLDTFPEPRNALPGDEFYFNETVSFVFPVGIRARNLAEFLMAIKHVDQGCIYYHFYLARKRLGQDAGDFATWIKDTLKKEELAARIASIDPFMLNIENIRYDIIEYIEEEVYNDMETVGR